MSMHAKAHTALAIFAVGIVAGGLVCLVSVLAGLGICAAGAFLAYHTADD